MNNKSNAEKMAWVRSHIRVKSHKRTRKNGVSLIRSHSRKSTKARRRILDQGLGEKDSSGLLKGTKAIRRGRELNKLSPGDHRMSKAHTSINIRSDRDSMGNVRGGSFNKTKTYKKLFAKKK